MREQVPKETKGGEGTDKEGKYIINRPLRVKSCLRCWSALRFKNNKLYCPICEKYRTAKTSHWIDQFTNIRFVTEEKMNDAIEEANVNSK